MNVKFWDRFTCICSRNIFLGSHHFEIRKSSFLEGNPPKQQDNHNLKNSSRKGEFSKKSMGFFPLHLMCEQNAFCRNNQIVNINSRRCCRGPFSVALQHKIGHMPSHCCVFWITQLNIHPVGLLRTSNRPVKGAATCITHNKHKRRTTMP
jgi:hypothetical protein